MHDVIDMHAVSGKTLQIILKLMQKYLDFFFTPFIFPDTQMYSLHFECLAGQENGPIHTHLSREHSWASLMPLIWWTHETHCFNIRNYYYNLNYYYNYYYIYSNYIAS